ncbi:MAG: NTP transferase domain-containing protein [Gammaproteobacteria bacterium]|nr:NTP transferase domain-containing protein [Gammaproteobacteria bacterium]
MTETNKDSVPALFGLVLAGGRSRRFGSDKAAIEIDGRTLLARTFGLLDSVADEVFVSVAAGHSAEELRDAFPTIKDDEPDLGPAGGLRSAHRQHPDAAWFVVACDLAGLDERTVAGLVKSRNAGKAATAYRSPVDGRAEPLCTIYEPATLARFARQPATGQGLSPRRLLRGCDVELVEPLDPGALRNINTPEDLDDGAGNAT